MKIKVELTCSNSKIILPVGFSSYIQALIYQSLPRKTACWFHENGFKYENRVFKLFCFSSILEKARYDKRLKSFIFPQKVSFYIASPIDKFLEQLIQELSNKNRLNLGKNPLFVTSLESLENFSIKTNNIKICALTPIEVHSTFTRQNKKITHYYSPFEPEFGQLINNNIKKKWQALYKIKCPYNLNIKPLFRGNKNEQILYFGTGNNKTLIKGWKGTYDLAGNKNLLQFALAAGIGSKSSQGCGMIDLLEEKACA